MRSFIHLAVLCVAGTSVPTAPTPGDLSRLWGAQPDEASSLIRRGLDQPSAQVRTQTAEAALLWALSWRPLPQSEVEAVANALLTSEAKELDAPARHAAWAALGRLKTGNAVARLLVRATDGEADSGLAATALGVALKNGTAAPVHAGERLEATALVDARPEPRRGAAYALARLGGIEAAAALSLRSNDDDDEVRRLVALGLGKVATGFEDQLEQLVNDPVSTVRAEAVRALTKRWEHCFGRSPCVGREILERRRADRSFEEAEVLVLAQAALRPSSRTARFLNQVRRDVERAQLAAPSWKVGSWARLDCRLAARLDAMEGNLNEVLWCGGLGHASEAFRILTGLGALADRPEDLDVAAVAPWLDDVRAPVRAAALRALGTKTDVDAKRLASPVMARVKQLVSDGDAPTAAAAALTWVAWGQTLSQEELAGLERLAREHPDVGAGLEPVLGRRPTPAPPVAQAFEAMDVANTPPRRVELTLVHGKIELRLDLQAPKTAANFVRLVEAGFYDGLTFHRVVPNFVAQSGDPRGDGEGGPGYTIPCETNPVPYVRGTVGMALSGKDTGGSQFFLTLQDAPHLTGKYTAFGHVVSGMGVADAIVEGDAILSARLLP